MVEAWALSGARVAAWPTCSERRPETLSAACDGDATRRMRPDPRPGGARPPAWCGRRGSPGGRSWPGGPAPAGRAARPGRRPGRRHRRRPVPPGVGDAVGGQHEQVAGRRGHERRLGFHLVGGQGGGAATMASSSGGANSSRQDATLVADQEGGAVAHPGQAHFAASVDDSQHQGGGSALRRGRLVGRRQAAASQPRPAAPVAADDRLDARPAPPGRRCVSDPAPRRARRRRPRPAGRA